MILRTIVVPGPLCTNPRFIDLQTLMFNDVAAAKANIDAPAIASKYDLQSEDLFDIIGD